MFQEAKVAAFTTANIRHRSVAKSSANPVKQPIDYSMFASDSLNSLSSSSVDSGNYSFSHKADDESEESRIRRMHNNIKRVIISEKIAPYQLKIQQSKGLKLIKLPPQTTTTTTKTKTNASQQQPHKRTFWFSTAAIQPTQQSYPNNKQQAQKSQKTMTTTTSSKDNEPIEDLSEEDIEFLLANTGFSLEQINAWCSEFMTKCKNGHIAYDQFRTYYKLLLPTYLTERQKEVLIARLFRLFDIDNDGCLNYAEFLLSFWIRCRAPIHEKFTWIFNMLDTDRNGYLNYSELYAALNACMSTHELDDLVRQMKRDLNWPQEAKTSHKSKKINRPFLDDTDVSEEDESDREYSSTSESSCLCSSSSSYSSELHYEDEDDVGNNIDKRLEEAIFMLDAFIRYASSSPSSYSNHSSSSPTQSIMSDESEMETRRRRVNINREQFLFVCERYESLRKLIIPIKYFYDAGLSSNEQHF